MAKKICPDCGAPVKNKSSTAYACGTLIESGMRSDTCRVNSMQVELKEARDGVCLFAGTGRGDCEHFVKLPGKSIPGQHDGPNDTVDAYGKPNGWCWSCWKSHQLSVLRVENGKLKEVVDAVLKVEVFYGDVNSRIMLVIRNEAVWCSLKDILKSMEKKEDPNFLRREKEWITGHEPEGGG